MTTEQKTAEVRMTVEGHVCVISLDNTSKKNAITRHGEVLRPHRHRGR